MVRIRPKYIPAKFYESLTVYIRMLEKAPKDTFNEKEKKIRNDQLKYTKKFLSNINLRNFYEDYGKNSELLNEVFWHFYYLPEFTHSEKTTAIEDSKIALQMSKALKNIASSLNESPDMKLSTQQFWENYLANTITVSIKNSRTEKESINEMLYKLPENIEFSSFLKALSQNLKEIARKKGLIGSGRPKFNKRYETAPEILSTQALQTILARHKVPKDKRAVLVTNIMSAVFNKTIEENTVRKRLAKASNYSA